MKRMVDEMAKQELSKAEIYRQERNKRLNEMAKKNTKRKQRHPHLGKIVKSVVAIVLAAVIIGGGAFYFIVRHSGIPERVKAVMIIGDQKVTVAQYELAYVNKYSEYINLAAQYKQYYGYDVYGFSDTTAPADQQSPFQDEDGNYYMWDEHLQKETIKSLKEMFVLYSDALANGYKLTKEEIEDVDKSMEELREQAMKSNLGTDAFLKLFFGNGVNKKVYRNYLEITTIVSRLQEDKQKEFGDSYTDKELVEEYNKNPDDHDVVSVRYFKFDIETLTKDKDESEDDLKKRQEAEKSSVKNMAEDMLDEITDEESFIKASEKYNKKVEDSASKENEEEQEDAEEFNADSATEFYRTAFSSLESTISKDAAKWAFGDDRKPLDKSVFTTDTACFVVLLTQTQYPLNTIDVRHILVKFNESSSTPTAKEKADAKEKAEEIYKEWKDGKATEDSFAELAKEKTEDEGSKENGGLYDDVRSGSMVDSFDNWCFDKARKAGDTGIVESTYGYHIMYFVSNNKDDLNWKTDLKEKHTQDDYSSYLEELLKSDKNKTIEKSASIDLATKNSLQAVDVIIKNKSSNSTVDYQ